MHNVERILISLCDRAERVRVVVLIFSPNHHAVQLAPLRLFVFYSLARNRVLVYKFAVVRMENRRLNMLQS